MEPGRKYGYRVQAFNASGRPVAGSGLVRVAVPDPGPDHLRFGCSAGEHNAVDQKNRPAVACKWSPSERRALDHYRLFKLELNAKTWRQVVYRGQDTFFVDEKVEAGHRYRYLVQAVDRNGRVIGTSDVTDVAVPPVVIVQPAGPDRATAGVRASPGSRAEARPGPPAQAGASARAQAGSPAGSPGPSPGPSPGRSRGPSPSPSRPSPG